MCKCSDYENKYGKPFKIDRNGTRYYYDYVCPRCGGLGFSNAWQYTGLVCYGCGGSGRLSTPKVVKEYTKEYAEKLEKARQKRREKAIEEARQNADATNQQFFKAEGFNPQGITYVVLGETYSIKDKLKALGAKFSNLLKWHIDHEIAEYPTVAVHVSEVYYQDYTYAYNKANWYSCMSDEYQTLQEKIKQANRQLELAKGLPISHYVGEIGSAVQDIVSYVGISSWDSRFGTVYMYKFVDSKGNVLLWKTSKGMELDAHTEYAILGTVKEHTTYKDVEQTVLTRCKIKSI